MGFSQRRRPHHQVFEVESHLVYAMPTTCILDRDGTVQKRNIGFNPKTAPERIEGEVKGLLSR